MDHIRAKIRKVFKLGYLKCLNIGHIREKKNVFKLVRGCQAITEKVQMQLLQNFVVAKGILLQI